MSLWQIRVGPPQLDIHMLSWLFLPFIFSYLDLPFDYTPLPCHTHPSCISVGNNFLAVHIFELFLSRSIRFVVFDVLCDLCLVYLLCSCQCFPRRAHGEIDMVKTVRLYGDLWSGIIYKLNRFLSLWPVCCIGGWYLIWISLALILTPGVLHM